MRVKGDGLLGTGQKYLFATSRDPEKCWYTVVAHPVALSLSETKSSAGSSRRGSRRPRRNSSRSIPRAPLGNLLSEALSPS